MTRLLIALIALLSINTVASGHSKMSGSTPEDGATVEAGLAAVSLTFDRKVRLTRVMLAAAPAEMTLAAVMSDVEALENQAEIGVLSELPKGFVEETEIDFDPPDPWGLQAALDRRGARRSHHGRQSSFCRRKRRLITDQR